MWIFNDSHHNLTSCVDQNSIYARDTSSDNLNMLQMGVFKYADMQNFGLKCHRLPAVKTPGYQIPVSKKCTAILFLRAAFHQPSEEQRKVQAGGT